MCDEVHIRDEMLLERANVLLNAYADEFAGALTSARDAR